MHIRLARNYDLNFLFSLRYDIQSCKVDKSLAREWIQHKEWFFNALNSPKHVLLIASVLESYLTFANIGVFRAIKEDRGQTYVSWAIHKDKRQKGYGTSLVYEVTKILSCCPNNVLRAEISRSNISSIRIAEKAGFRQVMSMNDVLVFMKGDEVK
jgi:RimJ/RimL family protein N-acetyltransferase